MAEVKYLDKTGLTSVWSKVKGIVTPKADKVSGATAGHLAGLNSSGNLTDSGLPATNVAQKDGSYSGMTVGAAEDLVSAESVASEFTSRVTGGSTAVGKGGTALVDRIKGRTLVWNQQVQNGNFVGDNYSPGWALSTNVNASFSSRILTLSNLTGSVYFSQGRRIEPGHKVLLAVKAGYFYDGTKTGSATFFAINGANILSLPIDNTLSERKYILTAPSISANVLGFTTYIPGSTAGVTLKIDCDYGVSVIDLTLMFGAGNEPSTVAEFEALYPGPYYDYNPGTLISNAATAIETVGFNQWDEEWEGGSINDSDGQPATNSNYIRSKNFIPAFPSTEYYKTTNARIFFYDAGKNYLGYTPTNAAGSFTTPAGTRYLKIRINYASPYQNDICISLSDPSRNGTYEPYWRSELELGLGDIKVKSHNIWDEEWEAGTIAGADGQNSSGSAIRSKGYIQVEPSTTYYNKGPLVLFYYDSSKNFISYSSGYSNNAFTTPSNCHYLRFATAAASSYGTTYQNDICINLSDPAFNGRYEPYGDGGVISITGGLKSAGTVYDEISGGKFVKRIESVDLGTLNWAVCELPTNPNGFRAPFSYSISDAICANYPCVKASSSNQWITPNTLYYGHSNYTGYGVIITASNTSYATAAAFKTAMAGVPLYYELAVPIEYELAEAIPTAMRNDPYGTERRLPEDTAAIVTAPFRADITYSTNIKEAVQSLPQNYININSMQDFLAELGTLMGGTWTMRQADGKFDFTFTSNPSNE